MINGEQKIKFGGVGNSQEAAMKTATNWANNHGYEREVQAGKVKVVKVQQGVAENFADGKGPGKPGDSQRHGIPKHATMAELEKASHSKGRKGQLARWQINMRRGHKKS